MSRLSLAVFWIGLILVGCTQSAQEAARENAALPLGAPGMEIGTPVPIRETTTVSLIPSPALISPLVMPAVSSVLPTPTPTPTASPTLAPTITPFPTLPPSALEPESLSQMVVREAVVSDTNYTLYRMSQTPLGATTVEWSPDGEHLWLEIVANPDGVLYFIQTAGIVISRGGEGVWLASNVEDPKAHDWSPDGRQIVYVHERTVWVADADGNLQHSLPLSTTKWLASTPRYSPSGEAVAIIVKEFIEPRSRYELILIDVHTGTPQVILQDVQLGTLDWSPEGDALAIQGSGELVILDLSTSEAISIHLIEIIDYDGWHQPSPMWVLGGTKVLTTVRCYPGVWVAGRDGVVERLDERDTTSTNKRPPGLAAPNFACAQGYAVASNDGRYVAYSNTFGPLSVLDLLSKQAFSTTGGTVLWSPTEPTFVRWREGQPLTLVDARDGATRQLAADGEKPAWSPDGNRIAFWRRTPVIDTLWLLNLDDDKPLKLLFSTVRNQDQQHSWPYHYDTTPQWSPDGDALAFVAQQEELPEVYLIELKDP